MLDTSTICTTVAISTPASAASGILDTQPVATRTTSRSASDCVIAPRRERPPLRTFTARARDRSSRGDAAEERRDDVGDALAEELAIGIVTFADGHRISDRRGKQALERRSAATARAGTSSAEKWSQGTLGADGAGQAAGDRSDQRHVATERVDRDRRQCDSGERRRKPGPKSCCEEHAPGDESGDQHRSPLWCLEPHPGGVPGGHDDLLARDVDAERIRHLLEPDDDRDPEREALDDGERYELHRPSGADESEDDQDEPC